MKPVPPFRPAFLLTVLLLCLALEPALAAPPEGDDDWRILDQASLALEKGDPGDALVLCEQARAIHASLVGYWRSELEKSFLPAEVKKAGDSLEEVYRVLEKRNDAVAVGILDAIFLTRPRKQAFADSVSKLLSWLDRKLAYPEADMLTGQVYEAEGENKLAFRYYEQAWNDRELLDIPDQRITLAYRMADLAALSGNPGSREKYLFLVISEDPVFGSPGEESPILKAMIRTLQTEPTPEKFCLLYRHENYTALKAYQDLFTFYYTDSGRRIDRAMAPATLAACISITRLIAVAKESDLDFAYTGLPDLFDWYGRHPELSGWASGNHLWDSFLMLAAVLRDSTGRQQAEWFWSALAGHCPDRNVVRAARAGIESRKE